MSRPEAERERREVHEARRALAERLAGTLDPNALAQAINRAREHSHQLIALPRPEADPNVSLRKSADIIVQTGKGVTVKAASARRKPITFGSTGQFVKVTSKNSFPSARLRFKLTEKDINHLDPDSVLVARWDESTEHFRVIPQSGYNRQFGYAFARISRPGLYTAVGVPRDPRIRTTLDLVSAMRGWMPLDPKRKFIPKICQLILCNSKMRKLGKNGRGLEELGFSSADFVGGPGGANVCDMCLGGHGLLDVDVLEAIGCPPRSLPCKIPPFWPRPCKAWVSVGPDNVPGRINALAIDPVDGEIIYAGSAAGGVFKTTNAAFSWTAMWEKQLSLAIGGLGIAPSDRSIIYAATGEWDVSVSAIYTMYPGVGVYRSSDAGSTWRQLAPISSSETSAVAVDPTNPNRIFVAGGRGLHRSTNGGTTWGVIPPNTQGVFDGAVSDVVIDPNNANRIYIGVHHSTVKTGGVYRSTDGGNTWTLLTNGISSGTAADAPKVALGRSGTHGTQFVVVKMSNLVFTSIDGGNTFTQKPTNPGFVTQMGRYMNVIAVDPTDEMVLFGADLQLFRSEDGGTTWSSVGTAAPARKNRVHDDVQALVFDPSDHNKVFVATDGGIYKSVDNGKNWEATHGAGGIPADPIVSSDLVTLQCWTIAVAQGPRLAYAVTTHDNYSYAWLTGNRFTFVNYQHRGEGGWIEYDPKDADIIYTDNWFSNVVKTLDGTKWWQQQVWSDLGIDTSNLNLEAFSIAWNNTSWLLAITRPTGVLFRSANGGATWTSVLSVAGDEISAVQFSPSDDNHAYAATNSGRVWHSGNGGVTWTELARVGLPNARVHDIEVDWDDPVRVYLAFGTRGALGGVGYRQLWRGEVGAGSQAKWFDISGGLPVLSLPDLGLTGLTLDPLLDDTLYVSNIVGVYRSTDGGDSWAPFDEGLPNCFVSDLDIRKRDRTLYVSTMGRGVFRRTL